MVHTQREFFRSDIIPQYQIQFIGFPVLPGNRRNGIVGLAFGLCKNKRRLVRIAPPLVEHLFPKVNEPVRVFAPQPQHGHGPMHNACLHILKACKSKMLFYLCLSHGKRVMPALEMVMAQNRTAYNGQIRIGTQEIVGELLDKIKKLDKSRPVNLHGRMLPVKYDAMLVVIYIRRILEPPLAVVDGNPDHPVVVSRRMVQAPRIAFVFHTQQAFRIAALFRISCSGDGFGVFFWFGKVNGNIQLAVRGLGNPFLVFAHPVPADVIRILAQLVKIIRGCPRPLFFINPPEPGRHFGRPWHQAVH